MSSIPKHAVITAFISKTKDRFHEYNDPKTVDERFQIPDVLVERWTTHFRPSFEYKLIHDMLRNLL